MCIFSLLTSTCTKCSFPPSCTHLVQIWWKSYYLSRIWHQKHLITIKKVRKKIQRAEKKRVRENSQQIPFRVRSKRHSGNCALLFFFFYASTINQGRRTMPALLILNLQQSGKYTPVPKGSCRSTTELILCSHSCGTWTFHSFFFFFTFSS